jgi:cytoskeletal protein CcmA (bactofilin family)
MSAASLANAESTAEAVAFIGKSVRIEGEIFNQENIFVDGEVSGRIEAPQHSLTVGPAGKVQASIRAREAIIVGRVEGKIEVLDKIDIRKNATFMGDLRTPRIAIEEGALLRCGVNISGSKAEGASAVNEPIGKFSDSVLDRST